MLTLNTEKANSVFLKNVFGIRKGGVFSVIAFTFSSDNSAVSVSLQYMFSNYL